jgi:hypothetical protein
MSEFIVRYVGLDVHKRVVEACIVDAKGNVAGRERFALNRRTLNLFATKVLRPGDRVALEATTNCWAVADALRPHVSRVLVSNPMATKAIAQAKVKTDKVDAHVLAQLLRCDFLPEVWQPDGATRQMRELTGRRSALVGQRTAMRNRIHSVLAMRLVDAPLRLFSAAGLEWLAMVELDPQGRMLIDSDLRQLEFLQKEIDALDASVGEPVLSRADHQAGQQPGPLDADRGRAAPRQTPRSAGPLLPPPGQEEKPQRGRRAEARHDRLADARPQRAVPLRHPKKHREQTGPLAREGHGRAPQGRLSEGNEVRGQAARRQPRDQVVGRGLPRGMPAGAAAAFAGRAAHGEGRPLQGVCRRNRRGADRSAPQVPA